MKPQVERNQTANARADRQNQRSRFPITVDLYINRLNDEADGRRPQLDVGREDVGIG